MAMSKRKEKLIFGAWVTVISTLLLTTATYAWMTIATTVTISNLELNVVTENAMEIALDENGQPGEWTTLLSLGDLVDPTVTMAPATWSAQRDSFCTVNYGLDGRPAGAVELPEDAAGILSLTPAEAEVGGGTGYVIALDLWLRTGSPEVLVYLSEPAERSAGELGAGTWVIGEPVWDAGAIRHTNGGNGAESVIRIGFRSYNEEYDTGGFVIYEPNVRDGEAPTTSIDGGPLEGDGKLIRQGTTTWTEQNPVLRDNVVYQMGGFLSENSHLFKLKTDVPRRFTLYIWLEGQDSGCDNSISGGKVLANLQFGATTQTDWEDVYRPTEDDR